MLRQENKRDVVPGPTILIDGNSLKLEDVERVARDRNPVGLSKTAIHQIKQSRKVVDSVVESGAAIYGVTTGFGKFKDIFIKPEDSRILQRNLLLSHAAGVGDCFDTSIVRAALLLRANALAKGYSGIRSEVVELLLECLNKGVHPRVPQQGSLGASGDLAPLAHLALVLIGAGEAEYQGRLMPGQEAMHAAGLEPIDLQAKEGLALLNGTQIMSAMGTLIILEAERLARLADVIGAMSLEAQLGSAKAFKENIQNVRPHPGQIDSARNLRELLKDSAIVASHADCPMVQDAYSLRCMPQVHGATRQALRHAREVFEIEINSATDNPLVFSDEILTGGNFHGQPLAIVLDYLAVAIAELANISERRTERLVNPTLSNGLPAFLTKYGGLNSGFMIAQYTAAALVSENKSLAHPASVDSIPTSANQEDHVSMGATAGRKASAILANVRHVLAIELLCASQGLDFRMHDDTVRSGGCEHSRLLPGPGVLAAYETVRKHIPFLEYDRELHLDISKAAELVSSGAVLTAVEAAIGSLN
ncbi:MAG TPA: histidine ammonia-lyase [Candidatus Obscuribacterales bacterium]